MAKHKEWEETKDFYSTTLWLIAECKKTLDSMIYSLVHTSDTVEKDIEGVITKDFISLFGGKEEAKEELVSIMKKILKNGVIYPNVAKDLRDYFSNQLYSFLYSNTVKNFFDNADANKNESEINMTEKQIESLKNKFRPFIKKSLQIGKFSKDDYNNFKKELGKTDKNLFEFLLFIEKYLKFDKCSLAIIEFEKYMNKKLKENIAKT